MTFTSSFFLIGLFPLFIAVSFLTRKIPRAKIVLLFLANSVFYCWGGIGAFLFVCVFSLYVWIACKVLARKKNPLLFALVIIVAISPLLAIKYGVFLISSINTFFHLEGKLWNVAAPLGISFFTFEAVSLLSSVYTEKEPVRPTILDTYLYLTFFVTVTSGPIIRFHDFRDGLSAEIGFSEWGSAYKRIAIGLCKKMLIANKLAVLADYYFNGVASGNMYSVAGLWLGSIAYSLQLYFDFSGYSDIAIGIGQLLGFKICENFNDPYCAGSITDFWRRWHISLSRWFRDYVYIPLGGNRCSVPRHIGNLLVVWLLTGMWHGAGGAFLAWGLGYFILLTAEKYIPALKRAGNTILGHVYTLFAVNLLWVPFRAASLQTAAKYIAGMFGGGYSGMEEKALLFLPYILAAALLCLPWKKLMKKHEQESWYRNVSGGLLAVFFCLAICAVINASYSPYIYGNF